MLDEDDTTIKAEIRRLKSDYFRRLDSKDWPALGDLFVEDATTAYDDGEFAWRGRDAIIGFLSGALGSPDCKSRHGPTGDPSIRVVSPTEAIADWHFADEVVYGDAGWRVRGEGIYHDVYVRTGDAPDVWRIAHTGYERVWEVREDLALIRE